MYIEVRSNFDYSFWFELPALWLRTIQYRVCECGGLLRWLLAAPAPASGSGSGSASGWFGWGIGWWVIVGGWCLWGRCCSWFCAGISTLNQTLAVPYSEIRIVCPAIACLGALPGHAHLTDTGRQGQGQWWGGRAGHHHGGFRVAAFHFQLVLFQHGGLDRVIFNYVYHFCFFLEGEISWEIVWNFKTEIKHPVHNELKYLFIIESRSDMFGSDRMGGVLVLCIYIFR